jgi:type III secretory pathway component EscT
VAAAALAGVVGGAPAALWRLGLAGGLGVARTLPVAWLVPAFGGPRVASQLRIGVGLILALLGLPALLPGLDAAGLERAGPLFWALLLSREVLIGVTVGLVAACAFRAAEAAGQLVDLLRGANAAALLAPAADARPSPLGELYLLVATVIFLELGGLGRLAAALARSYQAVPLGVVAPGAAAGLKGAAALITLASARLIESAVGLAAPVIVALLLADVALGAIARVAPRLAVHFAALPLKALLGVGVVLLGLGALDAALVRGFAGWLELAERGFLVWRH